MWRRASADHRAPRARPRRRRSLRWRCRTTTLSAASCAHDVADRKTGELLAACNEEIARPRWKFRKAGVTRRSLLWVNDLDRGPYISSTLRIDNTKTQLEALVEIYRMMRPGEPPTQGSGAEPVLQPVLHLRALRPRSRWPHEVQSPRRPQGTTRGPGVYDAKFPSATTRTQVARARAGKILDVIRTLCEIRQRPRHWTTSTTWAIAACVPVGEMAENVFRIGLVRVERAVRSDCRWPNPRA